MAAARIAAAAPPTGGESSPVKGGKNAISVTAAATKVNNELDRRAEEEQALMRVRMREESFLNKQPTINVRAAGSVDDLMAQLLAQAASDVQASNAAM